MIDARLADDFIAGHLPDAISIPVSATDSQINAALAAVDKSARIIVYCESPGCTYSRQIATALYAGGYRHLAIYPGGWQQWSQNPGPQ